MRSSPAVHGARPSKESEVIVTDFDAASVMIYPIPPSWTVDGSSFTPSPRLSKGDKAMILRLYGPQPG